jgi:hypothetical protein
MTIKRSCFVVKSERKRLYGPFIDAGAAAKWAHKHLRFANGSGSIPHNWKLKRVFKP